MKPIPMLALLLSLPASGTTVLGNPTSSVLLVDGPKTYVHRVLAHRCSGPTQTLEVGEVLEESDSTPITFAVAEFCAVDVQVVWTHGGALVTVPVDGFDSLKIQSGSPTVRIELDADLQSAVLGP